jgi:hypothetical protein
MCDGVVGVICNVRRGGLLKKRGGGGVNKWPMWWGAMLTNDLYTKSGMGIK